jgi:hypothetical protein
MPGYGQMAVTGPVNRDLEARVPNGTPAAEDVAEWAAAMTALPAEEFKTALNEHFGTNVDADRPVGHGLDGKTYPSLPRRETSAAPRRKSIVDAMGTAVFVVDRDVRRITNLVGDGRFPRNRDELSARNLGDLVRVRDALTNAIEQLRGIR